VALPETRITSSSAWVGGGVGCVPMSTTIFHLDQSLSSAGQQAPCSRSSLEATVTMHNGLTNRKAWSTFVGGQTGC
jgi:hypothetical protein